MKSGMTRFTESHSPSRLSMGFWALVLYALTPVISSAQHSASFRDVIIVLVALVVAVIFAGSIRFSASSLLYLLLYLFAFLSTALSTYVVIKRTMITYLAFCFILWLFAGLEYTDDEISVFKRVYSLLGVACAILITLSWIFDVPYGWHRYSLDIIGLHKNPNYINNIILLGFAFTLHDLLHKTSWKIADTVMLLVMGTGCFLTGTRAALLCIALLVVFAVCYQLFVKRKFTYMILLGVLSIAGYLVIAHFLSDYASERLLGENFLKDDGRLLMWTHALREWWKMPILGLGVDAANLHNTTLNLRAQDIHNIYLQLLCDQGLVGFGLFLAIVLCIIRRTQKRDRFLLYLMMISLFVPTMFQNGTVGYAFWWPLTILEIFSRKSWRCTSCELQSS